MCGRICVAAKEEEILWIFGLDGQLPGLHPMPPRYNIAPAQPILTITGSRTGTGNRARKAQLMTWSFLPEWVKDPAGFSQIINARAETIEEKPSFRNAIRRRRCLIPVSGFYEWHRSGPGPKQPHWFAARDEKLLALAGIWETWMGPNGEEVDGTAIVTTAANATMAPIHHRMPVIIEPAAFDAWLDTNTGKVDEVRRLMAPARDNLLTTHPVSTRVNRVANDDPALTDAAPLAKPGPNADREKPEPKIESEPKPESPPDQLSLF